MGLLTVAVPIQPLGIGTDTCVRVVPALCRGLPSHDTGGPSVRRRKLDPPESTTAMRWIRSFAPLVLVGLIGCGSEEDSVTLVPVKGTITRNSKPLANAKVSFIPDAANKVSTPGVDETGPEGNYLIKWKNRSGLAPGKYKVIVTPSATLPSGTKVPDEFKDDPMMAQMAAGIGVPGVEKKSNEVIKAEFEADVDDKGGQFDFDVKATNTSKTTK